MEGEVEEEVGLEDEEEEAEVVRGASNVGSRGTFPENVPKVVEAGVEGEEEEEMDVSSVESRAISPESVPMDQEDLELGLERASVTTAGRWDTLLESAVLPGEEGCNGQSGLYRNLENNVYNLSSFVIRINQSL